MDFNDAKLSTLQQIIDMMSGHMLGGLKKKGEQPQPAAVELNVQAEAPKSEHDEGKEHEDTDNPDDLHKLVEMYGTDDDAAKKKKKEEDDELTPEIAIPMG